MCVWSWMVTDISAYRAASMMRKWLHLQPPAVWLIWKRLRSQKRLSQWHSGFEWNQAVSCRLFSLSKRGPSGIDSNLGVAEALTSVLATRFDDFGPTFARVLHSLGHSLSGHLVGVVGGAHCDFVLHRRQQSQMRGP